MAARRTPLPAPLSATELAKIDRHEQRWRGIVGDNIRQARQAADLSLDRLSARANVSRNYLSLVELGRRSPTVDFLARLAYALNLSPADFLKPG